MTVIVFSPCAQHPAIAGNHIVPYVPYLIEDVIVCPSDLEGCRLFEVWYRVGAALQVAILYSRSDDAPEIGGTIQYRSCYPELWWHGVEPHRSGCGYPEDHLPRSWGKPTPSPIGLTDKQQRAFGGGP